jgi:hypothetical protein
LIENFSPYYYLIPFVIFLPFLFKTGSNEFKISIYLLILAIGYFLLISYPQVKLEWYDAPLYPILSILFGLFAAKSITLLSIRFRSGSPEKLQIALTTLLIFVILIIPYRSILKSFDYPEKIYEPEMEGAYIKHLKTNFPDIKSLKILKIEKIDRINDQVLFYKRAFERQYGYSITITANSNFNKGDYVIVADSELENNLRKNNEFRIINKWNSGTLFKILSGRSK